MGGEVTRKYNTEAFKCLKQDKISYPYFGCSCEVFAAKSL